MELPCNWIECSINEIADVFLGKTPKRAHYRSDGCYKVIKFRDLKNGYIDFNNKKDGFVIDDFKIINSLRDLRKNDVLITSAAHSGENIGKKCSIVRELPPKYKEYFFTGELLNIRSSADKNLAKWIYYFFFI